MSAKGGNARAQTFDESSSRPSSPVEQSLTALRAHAAPFGTSGTEIDSNGVRVSDSVRYTSFLSQLNTSGAQAYRERMQQMRHRFISRLNCPTCIVEQTFQPDPLVLVVRWRALWRTDLSSFVGDALSGIVASGGLDDSPSERLRVIALDAAAQSALEYHSRLQRSHQGVHAEGKKAAVISTSLSSAAAAAAQPSSVAATTALDAQHVMNELQRARAELKMNELSDWAHAAAVSSAASRLDALLTHMHAALPQQSHTETYTAERMSHHQNGSTLSRSDDQQKAMDSIPSGAPSAPGDSDYVAREFTLNGEEVSTSLTLPNQEGADWSRVSIVSTFKLNRDGELIAHTDALDIASDASAFDREREALSSFLLALKPSDVNIFRWLYMCVFHVIVCLRMNFGCSHSPLTISVWDRKYRSQSVQRGPL